MRNFIAISTVLFTRNYFYMPVSELLKSPFVHGNHYHLVFKSIDGLLLFRQDADYQTFLKRFAQFTGFVMDTWAYCLLNNHAHFIIKIKSIEAIITNIKQRELPKQTVAMKKILATPDEQDVFDEMVERQVNSFMVSYANYTKNKYQHHGGLFQKPFKRIQIDSDVHLQVAIIYTHANPVKHKVFNDYLFFPYSSYALFLVRTSHYCAVEEVLIFFGGVEKFILLHKEQIEHYYQNGFPNSKLE